MERRLSRLGGRIRTARLRRRLSAKLVAERAGMSVMTLRNVEKGGMGGTLGAYAAVLHVLGLDGDLDAVAAVDTLGRDLQDAALPQSTRTRSASRWKA
jgi:transcriptional regulator with XRE-family HTH domain